MSRQQPAAKKSLAAAAPPPLKGEKRVQLSRPARKSSQQQDGPDLDKMASVPLVAKGEPGPPKIVEIQEKYSAIEEQTAVCFMFIEGNPAPTFKFNKGAIQMGEGGRYKLISDGANNNMISLAISKVKASDEGSYKLTVENCHGKDEATFMLYVSDDSGIDFRTMLKKKKYSKWDLDDGAPEWGDLKHVEEEQQPVLKKVERVIDRDEEEVEEVEEKLQDPVVEPIEHEHDQVVEQEESQPPPQHVCKRDSLRKNLLISTDGARDLRELLRKTTLNHVSRPSFMMGPKADEWVEYLKDQQVKERKDTKVVFTCKFSKANCPAKWNFKRDEIFQGAKYKMTVEEDGFVHKLVISNPTSKDMGKYTCDVNNLQTSAYLDVDDETCKFTKTLKSRREEEGSTFELDCSIEKDVGVTWWFNDVEITPRNTPIFDHFEFEQDKRKRILRIKNCPMTATGSYKCTTTDDETFCNLTVYLKNRFLKSLENSSAAFGKNAMFQCQLADKKAKVKWFHKGEQIMPDLDPEKYEIKVLAKGIHQLIINGCTPGEDAGEVSCICDELESKAELTVAEEEKKVEIKEVEPEEEEVDATLKYKTTVPPQIVRDHLRMFITVKVGKNFVWDIDVIGDPITVKNWYKEDSTEAIEEEGNFTVVRRDYSTKFGISKVQRKDKARYRIHVENCYGSDEEWLELIVLGPPSIPIGPLICTDITSHTCKLHWEASADDGGVPIQEYEIEKLEPLTKRWIKIGKVPGNKRPLQLDVHDLEEGQYYEFRVSAVSDEGESEALYTDCQIQAKNPFDKPSKPGKPTVASYDEKSADVEWEAPASDGGSPIIQYIIQRKLRGEDNKWETCAIHETPTGTESLRCTVKGLKEKQRMQFRAIAVNLGGESGPSDPSDMHTVKHSKLKPRIDRTNLVTTTTRVGREIFLDVDVTGEPPPDIRWYLHGEEIRTFKNYKVENSVCNTKFTISEGQRKHRGKYKIVAKNEHGEDSAEVELVFLGPPSRPMGPLVVSDVTASGCLLKWKPPEDDGGKPVMGYVIEKKSKATGKWVAVAHTDVPECQVKGLQAGHEYSFRVRAISSQGESEPLETEATTKAKDPYTKPDPPQNVRIVDWDVDRMDLEWDEPMRNGGASISHYLVEMRSGKAGSSWQEIGNSDGTKRFFSKTALTKNEKYQFRVSAVNKAGPSEPSEATPMKLCKPRRLGPKINRDDVYKNKIHCRVGRSLKLEDVRVDGEPPATVTWHFKGAELSQQEDVSIRNPEYSTSIVISNASRKQSGMYLIKAINDHGQDECEVEFTVLGPSSPPGGPLEVSGVHKNGCKLKWKPPTDDGGSPITGYVVEKMDTETGKWVPCGRTNGDLELDVKGLETGKRYRFRVRAENEEGQSEPLEGPDEAVLIKNPFDPPGPPGLPKITDWTGSTVKLQWTPPLRDNGAPVEGYTIEYKEPNSSDWITGPKVKHPNGEVTGLTPGKLYEFRVKAENKAGLGEPSESTNPHLMKDRFAPPRIDRTNLSARVVKVNQQVVIEVDVTGEPAPETTWFFNGVEIVNSETIKTGHTPYHTKLMLIPASRSMVGKYTIKAKNSSGEDEAEMEINIKGKPGPPEGPLEISDITKNKCHLKWKPPLDDGGSPIEYYEVEKFDVETGNWTPAGTYPSCEADVKGLTEGKKYRFRVRAVNKDGDSTELEGTETIVAKNPFDPPGKPDRPSPLDWGPDFCDLKWKAPTDDGGAPITDYIIEAREIGKRQWKEALKTTAGCLEGRIEVPVLTEGQEYEFRVIAINKAGPSEPSEPSEKIKAENRFQKPKIDRSTLQKKVITTDTLLRIDAEYTGAPEPTITWLGVNGDVLKSNDLIAVEAGDFRTQMVIRKARRKDSGIYKIIAKNDQGEDTAEVEILVVDVPSAPLGPLTVSNVTAHACQLAWKAPEDDGGDPIKKYAIEKMDVARGVWVPCGETLGKELNFNVEGLNEGSSYQFRVLAINGQGESKPLETEAATLAKNPYGPPGPPENVKLVDWDRRWVKLSWRAPADNGGATVTHYIIEKKEAEVSSKWVLAFTTETDDCDYKVTELTENGKYRFRVKAVNKAGPGPPSEPSEEVTCKTRNAPPVIDRTNLEPLKVKVGESIKFEVKVSGEPPTDKEWLFGDNRIRNSDHLRIEFEDYKSTFHIASAKRTDSGTYVIKASNKNGEDEADKPIMVVGPPEKPQGPLKFSDIYADRCRVEWKKPKDDGGCPITHYVLEKKYLNSNAWVPCGKANDLACNIEGLEEMHEYQFRVKAVNAEGESEPLEGVDTVIAKNPYDPPGPPGQPVQKDYDSDRIDLKWDEPRNDGGSKITGYIIEVREAKDDIWTKGATIKGKLEFGTVTGLDLGQTYVFRVSAINAAGPGKPGPESDNMTCKHKKLKPKINRKTLREITVHVGETIEFDVDIAGEPPPEIEWSKDGRAIEDNELRHIRNKPYKSHFYIEEATRKDHGNYSVSAVNIHGEDVADVQVNVIDRPGPPENMEISSIHKNGCKLSWNPPKDDGGLPLEHYVVEKLDTDTGIWSPVGTTTKPSIDVTNLEPGKEYKFRVRAVNPEGESNNLESIKPIIAKDPFDVPLPPGAPEVTDWSENHMDLQWTEPCDDGGSPITGYIIEKKSANSPEWTKCGKSDGCKCTVNNLMEGEEYQFRITATNKAGPSEPSPPSRPKEAKARFKPPRIERKQLKDITVSVGEMLKFEGNIIGEPPADVTWKKEDTVIDTARDKSLIITNIPYNTKLIIRTCKRSDEGQYTVLAKNSVGEDRVIVNLTVVDRPTLPQGPLKATGITSDGCTLQWKRPKDNGGCPIEYYQIEKLDPDTGLWTPCGRSNDTSANVKGLKAKKKYKFRVSAVNAEGDSEPLVGDEDVEAKGEAEIPGAPTNLELVNADADSVELKWQPPTDDITPQVTGYIIEKQDKNGKWTKAKEVHGSQLTCSIPNLTPGETYNFRAKAITADGTSNPSNEIGPVTLSGKKEAPKIDRTNLQEVRCKAGDSFNFDVNVTGHPIPTKKWSSNGTELSTSEAIKIVCNDKGTKIYIRSATRRENGKLTLTAQNEVGTDTAEVNIIVIDVPTSPNGPIVVKDMTADDCVLQWKAPSDNGGLPISHYVIEKCDDSGIWLPAGETDGAETNATVKGLTKNKKYKFRVKAVNKEGKSKPLESSGTYEAKNPFDVPSKPGQPEVADFDSGWVKLKWNKPETDGGSNITGYIIKKKDEMTNKWEVCARIEGEEPCGKVSGLVDDVKYQFQVIAVNRAGESEASEPSTSHRSRAKNASPKIHRQTMMDKTIMAGTTLLLDVPVEGEPPPTKSWDRDGNSLQSDDHCVITHREYSSLLRIAKSKRSDSGTYRLEAKNENGSDSCTCNVTVLDVPGMPEGPVTCTDVCSDSMVVHWKPPKDNGGSEIKHYIVEKQDLSTMRWVKCGQAKQPQLRVDGLIEGNDYCFRIRAVNAQGESEALTGPRDPVTAKNPYDVPSRPGKPHAEDWSEDRVDLKWETPRNDGGSKIKRWIIEKKNKFGIWERAAECPGPNSCGTVRGLTEGMEYQFRVIAVNEAGESEPGEPSDGIVAEARYVKPWLDLSALQDITLCVGQTINFNVPIRGAPKPTVKWSIEGKSPQQDDRTEITTTRSTAILEVRSAKRSDSGAYTLQVSNDQGTAQGKANVKVIDRPAPPNGPLKLSDITRNSCNLSWGSSPDDGGSPIIHYLVEKMDTSRGSWVEAEISKDLKTTLTGLNQRKEYQIRVSAVNKVGKSEPITLDKAFKPKGDSDLPDPPGRPDAIDWDKDRVDLSWARPISDGGSRIRGYVIQKKAKGSNNWSDCHTINEDTNKGTATPLLENEHYQFRIIAFNDNGQSLPSEPSNMIQAQARCAPKIITPLKTINVKAGSNSTIDIEYVGRPEPSVHWYNEGTTLSTDDRTTISTIYPITTYHVVNCKRTDSGEITIKLMNEFGSDKGSFLFNVLDVPSAPIGPLGCDNMTESSCQLSWKPPSDNGGSEITSYLIEKRNVDHGGGWVPAVNFVDPHCLTSEVSRLIEGTTYQFRVLAVNAQGQSIPLTGDPVAAKAQCTVPGKPGRPAAVDADFTFIKISWKPPSNNGGSEITGYDVERRDLLGGRWQKVTSRPVPRNEYHDTDVEASHQYEYKVCAHNKAGQGPFSDPSLSITAKPMKAAPKLDMDVLSKRIRVKAGETIDVKIPYTGSPAPTVEWTKEGKKVVTNRFSTAVEEDYIRFIVANSNRLDSGQYTIKVTNEYGSDTGHLHVTVVDRPSCPLAPVTYTNIDRDTIKLEWNPPEDDGGSDITGYIVQKSVYGSNDWTVCPGYTSKCEFTARGLVEGRKYAFRIKAENAIGISDVLEGKAVEARSPYDPPGPPGQPKVTAYTKTTASLSWTPPTETGGREILGYFIEKREAGGEWTRTNNYPCPTLTYTVPGLRDGGKYEFRIIATNEAGPGAPSRPSDPIIAGVMKFPPGPPEGLSPDHVTKRDVLLSWRPPKDDGGSKIIGYMVEQRHKSESDFHEVTSFPHPHLSYKCTNLKEHEEYCFRVRAINVIGHSEPCKATSWIKIGEHPNQPKIDLGYATDIKVSAGDDFSVTIKYSGFPKPTAQLWNNELQCKSDSHIDIQVKEECVTISVSKSVHDDAGNYRLVLKNDAGYDTASFHVTVMDRPAPPRNLHASDFAGESFQLNWSEPLDIGGTPITNYIVERADKGSSSWQKVSSNVTNTFTRIRNLVIGKEYDFRVFAENHYGISDPARLDESVKARHPFDPPGAPGQPSCFSSGTDFIEIQWARPRSDGGAPITAYHVEKRKVSQNWSHAGHQYGRDLTLRVTGLEEGVDYEFRVVAENAAGQGQWSSSSGPITCSHSKCAPKITSTMRDLTVIAGNDFSIPVPYVATPDANAKWSINGQYVIGNDRIKMENSSREAFFYNKKATRGDSGMYCVKLTNSEGSDQATFRVTVVDRPSPPSKPIDTFDITPETCTLSWRPPTDDGGSPISNYVVEKFDVAAGYWSKVSGFVRGLTYDVLGLEPGKKYSFRVRAENQYGVSDPTEIEEPITAAFPFSVPDPPGKPSVSLDSPTSLNLHWERPGSDGGAKIQGYIIEFREVTEEKWTKCKGLVRSQTYTVTNLVVDSEYEFRVRAVNAAGESRPSIPSNQFHLKGSIRPPGPPGPPMVKAAGQTHVNLEWVPPINDGGGRILGYIVEKRDVRSSVWETVNNYNLPALAYTVDSLPAGHEFQFRVSAVNSAGKGDPSPATKAVKVGEALTGESPDFVRFLRNAAGGIGCKVELECEAAGKPAPNAKWTKNGREIVEFAGRITTSERNGIFILTINELWEIDEGEYKCQAYNNFGSAETTCRLKVGAAPVIESIPSKLRLPVGDNSKIKIRWSGDQPFDIELRKDGKLVSDSSKLKMTVFDEYLIIFLRDVTKDMAGKYTLKVSNSSGSAEGSFVIHVSGVPGAPVGPLAASEVTVQSCSLNWHPPTDNGGSKITHYVIERREANSDQWLVISSFFRGTNFIVQGLSEGQEYFFRVSAANANGTGPPLEGVNPVRALTQPDASLYPAKEQEPKPSQDSLIEEMKSAPTFTFQLRPRVMQSGETCKLLACLVTGHPIPTIQWFKAGKELDPATYPITHTDGVITIDIFNVQPGDSGRYRCVASNELGSDFTECDVIVERGSRSGGKA